MKNPLTHSLAVTGYVYRNGAFLLLKRKNPPLIWTPPGGRLDPNEDPRSGVLREIEEETGLQVEIVGLVDYWFGEIGNRGPCLSLDFLAVSPNGEVKLSAEHEDHVWATIADLEHGSPPLEGDPCSYRIEDFRKAEKIGTAPYFSKIAPREREPD